MKEANEASPDWVRITLRMTPQRRDLLRRAANVAGMPASAFVLRAASRAAEQLLDEGNAEPSSQTLESLPSFTKPAGQHWASIPAHVRQRLLSNVWCGHCRHKITISDFSGKMKGRDLLLVGRCADCRGEVARVIEGA